MQTTQENVLYAATVHASGVFFFATEAERNRFIAERDGFTLETRQVDPSIRRVAEDMFAKGELA